MTKKQFDRLKRQLEKTSIWLEILQDLYQKETGKRYVRPIRLSKKATSEANKKAIP